MSMHAMVFIEKSFDEPSVFEKELEDEDFKEFFSDEGEYLDGLSAILNCNGKVGDKFTVTYSITVVKEK